MALTLITPPAIEPVSLTEMKTWLKVEYADDDLYISALITAARQYAEIATGRQLITATWQYTLDTFPVPQLPYTASPGMYVYNPVIQLPRPPCISVASIIYFDINDNLNVYPLASVVIDSLTEPARITPIYNSYWPVTRPKCNAVQITYAAGYGAAATNVPQTIITAIKLLVANWYENRSSVSESNLSKVPMGCEALLAMNDYGQYMN